LKTLWIHAGDQVKQAFRLAALSTSPRERERTKEKKPPFLSIRQKHERWNFEKKQKQSRGLFFLPTSSFSSLTTGRERKKGRKKERKKARAPPT